MEMDILFHEINSAMKFLCNELHPVHEGILKTGDVWVWRFKDLHYYERATTVITTYYQCLPLYYGYYKNPH